MADVQKKQTPEQKVATAILEKSIGSIKAGGKTYEIAPPSTATLILISEIVSTLPVIEKVPKEQIVYSVLHNAKNFKALGDMAAVLVLGAKRIKKRRLFGLLRGNGEKVKRRLAKEILEDMSPSKLSECIVERLTSMEVVDFFAITTSLSEANLLKPTKEVVD